MSTDLIELYSVKQFLDHLTLAKVSITFPETNFFLKISWADISPYESF